MIIIINNFVRHKNWIDTCYVRIQLYWECTNSTLASILKSIWSNKIHRLKYQRSQTLGSKDIEIRKVELVTKTQFLCTSSFCLQLTVPFHSFSFSMILIYSRSTSLFSVQKQNKKGFFLFPVSFGEFWKLQNKNCFGVTSLNSDHAWFCEFLHFFWQ